MDITWLIEPFQSWDAVVVAKWYFAIVVTTFALAALHEAMGIEFGVAEKLDEIPGGLLIMLVGFVMPFIEEIIFRGIPAFFNWGVSGMLLGTVIWAFAHGKRVLVIAPMGVLFVKLWLSGFWMEAIAIHSLHNAFLVGIFVLRKDIQDFRDGEYDDAIENFASEKTTTIEGQQATIKIQEDI